MGQAKETPETIELTEEAFAAIRTGLETLGVRGWPAGSRTAHRVSFWEHLFSSTCGPFEGFGGQGFTYFGLAAYRVGGIDLCVADGELYGVAVADGEPVTDHEAYAPVRGRRVRFF